jgi:hypothetical protein
MARRSLATTCRSLATTCRSLATTCRSLAIARRCVARTHRSVATAPRSLATARRSLATATVEEESCIPTIRRPVSSRAVTHRARRANEAERSPRGDPARRVRAAGFRERRDREARRTREPATPTRSTRLFARYHRLMVEVARRRIGPRLRKSPTISRRRRSAKPRLRELEYRPGSLVHWLIKSCRTDPRQGRVLLREQTISRERTMNAAPDSEPESMPSQTSEHRPVGDDASATSRTTTIAPRAGRALRRASPAVTPSLQASNSRTSAR